MTIRECNKLSYRLMVFVSRLFCFALIPFASFYICLITALLRSFQARNHFEMTIQLEMIRWMTDFIQKQICS